MNWKKKDSDGQPEWVTMVHDEASMYVGMHPSAVGRTGRGNVLAQIIHMARNESFHIIGPVDSGIEWIRDFRCSFDESSPDTSQEYFLDLIKRIDDVSS